MAAYWRWVTMAVVMPITTATIRPIITAHFTRSGTMRFLSFSRAASSSSPSTLISASAISLPDW